MLGVKAQIICSHHWDVVEDPFNLCKGTSSVQEHFADHSIMKAGAAHRMLINLSDVSLISI